MKRIWIYVFMACGLGACMEGTQFYDGHERYEDQLQAGLESGERYDSLFLSLHLGMQQKDFYTTCWDLNKQGLLTQGPSNLSAEYDLEQGEVNKPAHMRFYPQFYENRIYNMPIEFSYQAFIPTDPDLSSDSLLPEVKKLMEKWYGKGFILLEDSEGARKVYTKVDGNRRIRIFKKDLATVAVDITDMPVYLELTKKDETN